MATIPGARQRYWPIYVIAALLLLQSLVMLAISIHSVSAVPLLVGDANATAEQIDAAYVVAPLALLAVLGIVAAVGFVFTLGFGWILGMVLQGWILLYCLDHYFFGQKPTFIYPVMFLSVLLVLYMNSSGVRGAFRSGRAPS